MPPTNPTRPAATPVRYPEPKCLSQIGTTPTGCPMFAVRRPDGQIVTVVIPGRDEDE